LSNCVRRARPDLSGLGSQIPLSYSCIDFVPQANKI
jgi:hypothetical protein